MNYANLFSDVHYDDENAVVTELFETATCKELRILMQANQTLCDRQSDFPIIIEVLQGLLQLRLEETSYIMEMGSLFEIEQGAIHHLEAKENTILRVTLLTR